ncbi:MAG: WD40 repeat domain-containing protein [Endozoicomonas sp.]|uniref:WD40 repeat domain-containing protein n=1 Tax=Endozoicomonas sp. TaxID=1892382 RepID=UPI003D9B5472
MSPFKHILFPLLVLISVWQAQARPILPNYLIENSTLYQEARVLFSAFSHDDKLLATSSGDQIKLWRARDVLVNGSNAKPLAIMEHMGEIPMLIFSPDDKYLLTNSYDNSSKGYSN